MTDAFAELVMPIFRRVIDLQDRLAWGESRSLEEVKKTTSSWIEEARRRALGNPRLTSSYELARYGLVAWIDEVLTDSEWGRKVDWGSQEHVLEWDLYGSHDRAYLFYQHAEKAEEQGDMDALEVHLLCVTLGFKGELVYDEAQMADWVQRVYNRVVTAGGVPARPFPDDPPRKDRFSPLRGPSLLVIVSVLVAITALITLAAYLWAVHVDYNAHHYSSINLDRTSQDRWASWISPRDLESRERIS
jgi:type VI secretion system protein ImpK